LEKIAEPDKRLNKFNEQYINDIKKVIGVEGKIEYEFKNKALLL
jgi:hypothetical protein